MRAEQTVPKWLYLAELVLAALVAFTLQPLAGQNAKRPASGKALTHVSTRRKASQVRISTAGHAGRHPGRLTRASSTEKIEAPKSATKRTAFHRRKRRVVRGQQKIDAQRAQEIQQALIREHYLSGQPAGIWNQTSEDAMRRYQADHGWQSKTVPDARALISLGLGPSHDHLLNPESAMTGSLAPVKSSSASPSSLSPDPPSAKSNASTAPADSRQPQ